MRIRDPPGGIKEVPGSTSSCQASETKKPQKFTLTTPLPNADLLK